MANYIRFRIIVNTLQGMKNLMRKAGGWAVWGLILLLVLNLAKDVGRARDIDEQINDEKLKLAKIEAENKRLELELARAQSENFIEKQVRDKLGLGREGEAIVVLPDAETLRKLAPVIKTEEVKLPDPNWLKWKKLFF